MLNKRGFTIVELLIVIVVIAILAAISVVAYNNIQDRAKTSTLKSEMSQLQRKILADSLQYDGESSQMAPPLAHGKGAGTWKLSDSLQNTQKLTLYSVFDTNGDMNAAWNVIARGEPAFATNYISVRTVQAGNTGVQGFWQTSAQTNQAVGTTSNIRNVTGRHVGWITSDGPTVSAGFNNTSQTASPSAHGGWTFDTVGAYNQVGIVPVATLMFGEYHDSTTRTQVLRWLDREHAINYYN